MYLRLSIVAPLEEHLAEAERLEKDLLTFYSRQPGFVEGYFVKPTDGTKDIARLTVWETASAADHAATSEHALAVGSRLLQITERERVSSAFRAMRHDAI